MLIDTHAHLNFSGYKDSLNDLIKRSVDSGVKKIICVSSNVEDSVESVRIAKEYPGIVYASVGIHPQCTDPENLDDLDVQIGKIEKLVIENIKYIVAIGECGLDFTDVLENERKRNLDEQNVLLREQVKLAIKYDLPILLHFNKSHDYFLEHYQKLKELRGIFHCYVGGKKRSKNFLEFEGFMFGVTGLFTYDDGLQRVIKEIPLERIVLETDCPFLAPGPYRGDRNEPSYIGIIASKLSEIKKIDQADLEKILEINTNSIFRNIN